MTTVTVHHVIVAEPYSRYPDELEGITFHHVSEGGGCMEWRRECLGPHLWYDALYAISDDEGTDDDTRALAEAIADDAAGNEHVWHSQRHEMLYGEWHVPVHRCGFEEADHEYDIPPDLPPGVYAVTCEQDEWGGSLHVGLTDEPVPDPEQFLRGAR